MLGVWSAAPTEYRDTVCTREGLRDRAVSRAVIQEVVGGLEKEEGGRVVVVVEEESNERGRGREVKEIVGVGV